MYLPFLINLCNWAGFKTVETSRSVRSICNHMLLKGPVDIVLVSNTVSWCLQIPQTGFAIKAIKLGHEAKHWLSAMEIE